MPLGEMEKRPRGVLKPTSRAWVVDAVARSFDAALGEAPSRPPLADVVGCAVGALPPGVSTSGLTRASLAVAFVFCLACDLAAGPVFARFEASWVAPPRACGRDRCRAVRAVTAPCFLVLLVLLVLRVPFVFAACAPAAVAAAAAPGVAGVWPPVLALPAPAPASGPRLVPRGLAAWPAEPPSVLRTGVVV
jgi:hypothetical protein